MSEQVIDVVGIGQCCYDFLGTVAAFPKPDVKCECQRMIGQGGGPAATGLTALARWGYRCAFIGIVGDDALGGLIRGSLADEGIDTTGLITREQSESQLAFVAAEPAVGTRTIFWHNATGHPLQPDEVDRDRVQSARLLYTDGRFAAASVQAAHWAREAGVPVLLDAGSFRPELLDVVRVSDVCIVSEPFANGLAGSGGPVAACRKLETMGPTVVGVTLGARGYLASVFGHLIERPAYIVDAVDTTGCGDVFHAGVAHGILCGWTIASGLDFGAWAAAAVASRLGGRTGIPARAEVDAWLPREG